MRKILIILLMLYCVCASITVEAKVVVVDGDSLLIDGRDIRLEGIDAPEYNQKCYDAQNKLYDCGQKAKEMLQKLVAQGVVCKKRKTDRYKRDVSICYAGSIDVNKEMVHSGWAVAYTRYLRDYEKDELEAKNAKRGIWCGRFMRPELFRVLEREQKRESR